MKEGKEKKNGRKEKEEVYHFFSKNCNTLPGVITIRSTPLSSSRKK